MCLKNTPAKFQRCAIFVAGVFFLKRNSFDDIDDRETLFVHEVSLAALLRITCCCYEFYGMPTRLGGVSAARSPAFVCEGHPAVTLASAPAWLRAHDYFECALPFGLLSSPAIFNSVAGAVEWILINKLSITALLHYLDDYLNVAGLSLPVATKQLSIILDVFRYLGIPITTDKTLGQSQVLPFLD